MGRIYEIEMNASMERVLRVHNIGLCDVLETKLNTELSGWLDKEVFFDDEFG